MLITERNDTEKQNPKLTSV